MCNTYYLDTVGLYTSTFNRVSSDIFLQVTRQKKCYTKMFILANNYRITLLHVVLKNLCLRLKILKISRAVGTCMLLEGLSQSPATCSSKCTFIQILMYLHTNTKKVYKKSLVSPVADACRRLVGDGVEA